MRFSFFTIGVGLLVLQNYVVYGQQWTVEYVVSRDCVSDCSENLTFHRFAYQVAGVPIFEFEVGSDFTQSINHLESYKGNHHLLIEYNRGDRFPDEMNSVREFHVVSLAEFRACTKRPFIGNYVQVSPDGNFVVFEEFHGVRGSPYDSRRVKLLNLLNACETHDDFDPVVVVPSGFLPYDRSETGGVVWYPSKVIWDLEEERVLILGGDRFDYVQLYVIPLKQQIHRADICHIPLVRRILYPEFVQLIVQKNPRAGHRNRLGRDRVHAYGMYSMPTDIEVSSQDLKSESGLVTLHLPSETRSIEAEFVVNVNSACSSTESNAIR